MPCCFSKQPLTTIRREVNQSDFCFFLARRESRQRCASSDLPCFHNHESLVTREMVFSSFNSISTTSDRERTRKHEEMNSAQSSLTGLPTLAGLKMSRRKMLVEVEERGRVEEGESRKVEASISFQ